MFDFNKTDHEIRKNHNLCSSFKVFFQIDFVKFLTKKKENGISISYKTARLPCIKNALPFLYKYICQLLNYPVNYLAVPQVWHHPS